MTWASNAKLLAIAVLLTLYVRFFEMSAPVWERRGRVFSDLEPSDVVALSIARPSALLDAEVGVDARPIALKYESHKQQLPRWWVVEPFHFPAFHPRVQGLIFAIVDMVRVGEIREDKDAEAFAENAFARIDLKTASGREVVIEIGDDHPDDSVHFTAVRVDGEFFWTRKDMRQAFVVTLDELRSRALVPIPPDEVSRVNIHTDHAVELTYGKESREWRMTKPVDVPADRENVGKLVADLNSWAVVDFVDEAAERPEELAKYGLDNPAITLTIERLGGQSLTLDVSPPFEVSGRKLVHVRHRDRPFVFTAANDVATYAAKDADFFRSRYLLDWDFVDVKSVAISTRVPEAEYVMTRMEVEEPSESQRTKEIWRVHRAAQNDVFTGDEERIANLIGELGRMPIEKFLDALDRTSVNLDPAAIRITVKLQSGRQEEILLGDRSTDPLDADSDVFFAARSSEVGGYLVFSPVPKILSGGAFTFYDRSISDVNAAGVVEIQIGRAGRFWNLLRPVGQETWALEVGSLVDGAQLDSRLVDELVNATDRHRLRAEQFFETVDPAVTGLAEPGEAWQVRIVYLRDRRQETFSLRIGRPVDGVGRLGYYAQVERPEIPLFSLSEELTSRFDKLHQHLQAVTKRRSGSAAQ